MSEPDIKLYFTLSEAKNIRNRLYASIAEAEKVIKSDDKIAPSVREIIECSIAGDRKLISYLTYEIEKVDT